MRRQYLSQEEGCMKECPECKKIYKPILIRPRGDSRCIQDIFPETPRYQREQLLSGLCSNTCWKWYTGHTDKDVGFFTKGENTL